MNVLRGQPLADPLEEAVALEEPEVEQQAQRALHERHPVLPGAILELAVVERDDDLAQLRGRVARGQERRRDRPGGCAGDVLGALLALFERRQRAGEPDPLDAAAFEDEIGEVLLSVHAASSDVRRGGPHRRGSSLNCATGGGIMQPTTQLAAAGTREEPWHTRSSRART